jgi:hypothetical protein
MVHARACRHPRPRHQVPRWLLFLLRPAFRYSESRDAWILRRVGTEHGPVLCPRESGSARLMQIIGAAVLALCAGGLSAAVIAGQQHQSTAAPTSPVARPVATGIELGSPPLLARSVAPSRANGLRPKPKRKPAVTRPGAAQQVVSSAPVVTQTASVTATTTSSSSTVGVGTGGGTTASYTAPSYTPPAYTAPTYTHPAPPPPTSTAPTPNAGETSTESSGTGTVSGGG